MSSSSQAVPARTAALYVSRYADFDSEFEIENLTGTGFSTLVLSSFHVDNRGTISFDGKPIVSAGKYVGPPELPQTLQSLLSSRNGGSGSVTRLGFSFGGNEKQAYDYRNMWRWFVQPTPVINLVHDMFPRNNMLVRNMLILRSQFNFVDFIALDCQEFISKDDPTYDWMNTAISFGRLVRDVGFNVSLCPLYTDYFSGSNPAGGFLGWINVSSGLYGQQVHVDAFYLQISDYTNKPVAEFVSALGRIGDTSGVKRIAVVFSACDGSDGLTPEQMKLMVSLDVIAGQTILPDFQIAGVLINDYDRIAGGEFLFQQYLDAVTK